MTVNEGLEAIKKLLFADVPPPVVPVAPAVLAADPMTAACQACIDAGVPEPCLSTCKACIVDMSEENRLACIEACKTLANDPVFGELCKACITALGGSVAPAEAPQDMSQFKAEFDLFKTEFAAHKAELTHVKTDFATAKETIANQDLAFKKMLEVVEALSKVEVAKPAQEQVSFEKMTPLEKFRASK